MYFDGEMCSDQQKRLLKEAYRVDKRRSPEFIKISTEDSLDDFLFEIKCFQHFMENIVVVIDT